MAEVFGLDLGTTNTIAAVRFGSETKVHPFLDGGRPHPSVVRYNGNTAEAGRVARDQLDAPVVGVIGDFVRSPKRYLGKGDLYVGGVARDPATVVADLLRHVRDHAVAELGGGTEIGQVVATIPITMDGRGRSDYRRAAQMVGIDIYQFVHEPLAALYGFLRREANYRRRMAELDGKLALVFDWGGGTLDLTLCRLVDGSLIQVHNIGDDQVGGDRFDERLMRLVADRHRARWNLPSDPPLLAGAGAKLNAACELSKIRLSRENSANVLVGSYAKAEGGAQTLEQTVTREDLESATRDLVAQGLQRIDELVRHVGIPFEAIELCLATGGMVQMPAIRSGLIGRFGPSRVPRVPDGDQIIAEGAAWIASDRAPLTLAKPFEVLHADDAYVALLAADVRLPTTGDTLATKFSMYCVDPRDGYARFLFARPKTPERGAISDRRDPYGVAVIAVDPTAAPLLERLEVNLTINSDLIVHIDLNSSLARDQRKIELYGLEFGLKMVPA